MTTVQTQFGDVSMDQLVKIYESYKTHEQKNAVRRKEFLQTPEGKDYNRQRAKAYYARHKDEILIKRKIAYLSKQMAEPETSEPSGTEVSGSP